MHSQSDNIGIMIYEKADEVIEEYLNHFLINVKLSWKHQWKVVTLSLIVLICITNFIR